MGYFEVDLCVAKRRVWPFACVSACAILVLWWIVQNECPCAARWLSPVGASLLPPLLGSFVLYLCIGTTPGSSILRQRPSQPCSLFLSHSTPICARPGCDGR